MSQNCSLYPLPYRTFPNGNILHTEYTTDSLFASTGGLESASLIASKHYKTTSSSSSKEHPATNAVDTDPSSNYTTLLDYDEFDFVLDLNQQEDFDRLLNMLSRSGPAKYDEIEASVRIIY